VFKPLQWRFVSLHNIPDYRALAANCMPELSTVAKKLYCTAQPALMAVPLFFGALELFQCK